MKDKHLKKYKLYIDREKCNGCNVCGSLMPEIFDIDDNDGLVKTMNSIPQGNYDVLEIDSSRLKEFEELVKSCPPKVFRQNK